MAFVMFNQFDLGIEHSSTISSKFIDPTPDDLTLSSVKLRWHEVEVRTDYCWKNSRWLEVRGDIPIEFGASWISPKCIEAQRLKKSLEVKILFW